MSLAACSVVSAVADDTRSETGAAAPAQKAAPSTKPDGKEPKKDAAGSVKEDPEAELLTLFKKEESITNTLGMVMVWVPKGYRVDRYEVTQREFEEIMQTNQCKFKGANLPVDNVTWEEAAEFCKKLTDKERAAGKLPKTYLYALPTEDQWDYYVDEATLQEAITSYLGDRKNPENVGGLGANKFGLYDVRGNVWEWCSSPLARGGSWRTYEDLLAVSFRYVGAPGTRYDDIGFRCVLIGQ
jgi:formylglycine-generating enzyme required for sulfatase activity